MLAEQGLLNATALVTGASSGIGRATALEMGRCGSELILLDVNLAGLRETASLLPPESAPELLEVDLGDFGTLKQRLEELVARRDIHFLANVAAARFHPDGFDVIDPQVWSSTLNVNLLAPALLTQTIGRHMADKGIEGGIVNVSSSSAFRATGQPPLAYACSKAALLALTRAAAARFGPNRINVNAVVPGATLTEMALRSGQADRLESIVKEGPLANLLGRLSMPEDVAKVICFLFSQGGRQITGQAIHTSAGLVV